MKLMITLIKDKDNEEIEPGESVVFDITEEQSHSINELISAGDFDRLKETLSQIEDTNGEKYDIGMDDIYGFEFRL